MTVLAQILDALARHGGSVSITRHALQRRSKKLLHELRPDLPFAKQVDHWAQCQRLICQYDPATCQFKFTRISEP